MSAVIKPVNRNLPPAERIAAVQERINQNLYGTDVLVMTAEKLLPHLLSRATTDRMTAVELERAAWDALNLADRFDGRDYNDQEGWR